MQNKHLHTIWKSYNEIRTDRAAPARVDLKLIDRVRRQLISQLIAFTPVQVNQLQQQICIYRF